ncbi:hypothetical protein V1524DRAFT_77327 [Lipomyces starkeyi]
MSGISDLLCQAALHCLQQGLVSILANSQLFLFKFPTMASNNIKRRTRTLSTPGGKQLKWKSSAHSQRYCHACTRGNQQGSILHTCDKMLRLPFGHAFSAGITSINTPRYCRRFVLQECNKILKRHSFYHKSWKDLHTLKYRQIVLSRFLAYGMKTGQEFPICVPRKVYDVVYKALGDSDGLDEFLVRTDNSVGGKASSHIVKIMPKTVVLR